MFKLISMAVIAGATGLTAGLLIGSSNVDNAPPAATPRPAQELFIESVTIEQMPFTNKDGAGWDLTTGPDVFFDLVYPNGNNTLNWSNTRREDITPKSLPLEWKFKTIVDPFGKRVGFRIGDFSGEHFFRIYDYDETSSDLIGTVEFTVNDLIKSQGNGKEFKIVNGNVTIRITVR